jgi:hypothetical protein
MHASAPVQTMHWLTAGGTLLLTIGSALQAWTAISAYSAELEASGLKTTFTAILGVAKLNFRLTVGNVFAVVPLVRQMIALVPFILRTINNITALLDIPDITPATSQPAATGGATRGEADGGASGPPTVQVTAARIRQLLFTGMTWILIMYGSLALLVAVSIQLVLDYLH